MKILFNSFFLLQEFHGSEEIQSTFNLPGVLGNDCLYACMLDALGVSQRQTVRAVINAKFKS